MIILDVPTRLNSTYMMLEVAEKFEKAFARLAREDAHFERYLEDDGGPPSDEDWSRARIFIRFLQIFYHATLSFSSSLNVTSNTFFHVLCKILCTLNKWIVSDDLVLREMASAMKAKFDKYWDDSDHRYSSSSFTSSDKANKPFLNYLVLVAVFLDPHYKLESIQFTLSEMYGEGEKSSRIFKKLKDIIAKLFEQYTIWNSRPLKILKILAFLLILHQILV